jgi:hypothetical protein
MGRAFPLKFVFRMGRGLTWYEEGCLKRWRIAEGCLKRWGMREEIKNCWRMPEEMKNCWEGCLKRWKINKVFTTAVCRVMNHISKSHHWNVCSHLLRNAHFDHHHHKLQHLQPAEQLAGWRNTSMCASNKSTNVTCSR